MSSLDPAALIGFWVALFCSVKRFKGGGGLFLLVGVCVSVGLEEVVLEGESLFCFASSAESGA